MHRKRTGLLVAVAAALGILLGSGAFTFLYAQGDSYLNDRPETCINCHVMQEHYDAWINSSHANVAVCNDCHMPSDNVVAKYWAKAVNGFHHSLAFTTGRFPEHIMITPGNRQITEGSCRGCHAQLSHEIDAATPDAEPIECIRCHTSVGHAP